MLTRKPNREEPNEKTRSKARRAHRAMAKALAANKAATIFDSRGRPRKNRYFVKA